LHRRSGNDGMKGYYVTRRLLVMFAGISERPQCFPELVVHISLPGHCAASAISDVYNNHASACRSLEFLLLDQFINLASEM
jgi:hypothetical protein